MKTKLLFAVMLGSGLAATAQQASFRLSGKLEKKDADSVYLSNVTGFKKGTAVAKDGSFNLLIKTLPTGFYTMSPIGNLYLESGSQLQVSFSPNKGYRFSGKGALENNLIREVKESVSAFLPVGKDGNSYKLYDVSLPAYIAAVNAYKAKVVALTSASKSAYFKKNVIEDANAHIRNISTRYALYYGVDSVKQASFYKKLETPGNLAKLNTDSLLKDMYKVKLSATEKKQLDSLSNHGFTLDNEERYKNSPEYRYALSSSISRMIYSPKYTAQFMGPRPVRGLVELNVIEDNFSNPLIKSSLQYQQVSSIIKQGENAAVIDSVYKSFNASPASNTLKKELALVYANYKNFGDNAVAPLFSYEQVNGEKVALESLRGKYVYIDVWATWCGPCKREIPALGEIEEKYKGKNIHFVSLSVDVEKDKEKWKNFVQENHLKGIQIIADKDFNSDFIKKFNINSIPRFILIDPKGKIVSANAKRPSDPELQKQLDQLL